MRPLPRAELVDQLRSGERRDLYLSIPGRPQIYRDVEIIEVGDQHALVMAADGTQARVRLRSVCDPDEFAAWARRKSRNRDRITVLDLIEMAASFLP